MKVLSPEGVVREPEAGRGRLAPRLADLTDKTIGVLDDGFSGSGYYMRGIAESIENTFPAARVHYWAKPFHTRPAPVELIAEIARTADAVIVGIAG